MRGGRGWPQCNGSCGKACSVTVRFPFGVVDLEHPFSDFAAQTGT